LDIAGNTGDNRRERAKTLWLLGWTVGGVLMTAFVLNAIALASV
jgi:hypothetical protein